MTSPASADAQCAICDRREGWNMTAVDTGLAIPEIRGIGDARHRTAQTDGWQPPPGTAIVSADSHWLEGDIWVDQFPAHLKDRAPRMTFQNGGYELYVDGKLFTPEGQAQRLCAFECVPGFNDVEARLRDLDAEGVNKEILFPQRSFGFNRIKDLEYREWCYRAYNQHLAEVCAQQPDRLYGVAILKWWEPEQTRDLLAEVKALGFKTAMVPLSPGNHADDEPVRYNSERMDPFWSAIEEAGLPICFHIGENSKVGGRGLAGSFVMEQMGDMRNIWSALTFGGVFDRNPTLRVVFVESGLH
jgi:predicted TIM-barrel fold metal-dependent hydrolase